MAIEIAKDKIKVNQIVAQKQEIITIDGDVIVNDVKPDVLKIISVTGTLCLYKKEVLNEKIKIEGCVNTYIVYLADDETGSVRTINTSLDFAEVMDMEKCKENMLLEDNINIKGFETKVLNGRKLRIKVFLDANMKICANNEIEIIVNVGTGEEDIQMLNCKKEVMSLIGENSGKTSVKDTISVNSEDELAEIMKTNFSISDIDTKVSYNKVLIKANANVQIMYLTEDNKINEVVTKIPLMGFIDMPNITEDSHCASKVKIRNIIVKSNNSEEHSIYLEADIDLFCRAYEKKEINMIEDVYSVINNLDLKTNKVKSITEQFTLNDIVEVKQVLTNSEILYSKVLGINIVPSIEKSEARNNKIVHEGKLSSEIIIDNDNNINTINVEIPFESEMASEGINVNSNLETYINIASHTLEDVDGKMILEIKVNIDSVVQNSEELNFLQDIVESEPLNKEKYSMIIYFVKPGDTLWKIAKQFRSRVEDISRVNGIEDENKIFPGTQLYIPQFVKSKAVV